MKSKKGRINSPVRKPALSQASLKKTKTPPRESTLQYKTLVETVPVGIVENDTSGIISYCNGVFTDLVGYTAKELIGKHIWELVTPKMRNAVRDDVIKILQDQPQPTPYITKLVRKNNRAINVQIDWNYKQNKRGTITGFISAVMDITGHKEPEAGLLESEEQFRTAIEHSHDSVALVRKNKLVYVNQRFLDIFGYDTPEEVIGKSPTIVIHPDDRPMTHHYRIQRERGEMFPEEYVHKGIKKDGTMIFIEVSVSETLYRGEPVAFIYQQDITERKMTEEALRESENKFRDLAEKSIVGIYIIQDKAFKYVNARFAEIHGYAIEEIIDKKSPQDFFFLKDLPAVEENTLARSLGGVRPLHYEFRIVTKTGETKYVEVYGTRTIFQSKSATIGTIIDITERKQAEEALRKSEEKYRNIFENAVEGIFQTTPEGQFLSANPALARIFGFGSPGELIASNTGTITPLYANPEDLRTLVGLIETCGSAEGFETQLLRKDEKNIWASVNARAIHDESGRTAYLEGTITDITKRKFAEGALLESEAKYRNVVDHLIVGFYIIQDNRFCFVNRRFCEMSGYSYDELVDKAANPMDLIHDDDKKLIAGLIVKRLSGETDYAGFVYKGVKKDGQIMIVKGLSNLMIYNGRPAVAGTVIDITRETTLESQLRQAQKMEAVGTLAGGIAHDFNNILTAIIGYGRLLQMKMVETDPLRTYVAHMLSSSETAANLTRNLLTFSRKQIVELKPVKVGKIVKGMARLLKSLLTEDIELKIISPDPDITIMADMSQIEQVLLNLASNANDAMPKGGTLAIETKEVNQKNIFVDGYHYIESGQYASISVADTGTGIDERTRSKIFEPFFTTKEVGRGTGLGLSIVHGIVDQHHGYITVDSTLQGGTVFSIYLPAIKAAVEEIEALSPVAEGGTETILVAEDDVQVRSLTTEILNSAGYTVIETIDGEDAIEKFVEHSDTVDLLLLDVVMPRKNGKDAHDEIKRIKPDVRVIFMSGYTGDVIIGKGIIEKEYAFIQKPLSPNELLLRVKEVLSR